MKGAPAIYLGQIVDKKYFRTFVYSMDGSKKLVESWDEYEQHMESGLWFSTPDDARCRIAVERPKRVRNKPVPVTTLEFKEEPQVSSMNLSDHVVKDDDFLPKTGD